MFSNRLQSSYIRECLELGSNLLYVVLIIISKCHTKSSIGNQTKKKPQILLVHEVNLNEMNPKIK